LLNIPIDYVIMAIVRSMAIVVAMFIVLVIITAHLFLPNLA